MLQGSSTGLSYIVFLHQTTTTIVRLPSGANCLISSFYIKPQPWSEGMRMMTIVLYRLSTSNHNFCFDFGAKVRIVLYRLSTSNHNQSLSGHKEYLIVLYRLSTSNHNLSIFSANILRLSYIVFLHQTTTRNRHKKNKNILSYIVFLHQTTTISLIH